MVINIKKFYENISLISNPDNLLVLVNKNNKLYEKFIPNNLEIINEEYSVGEKYLSNYAIKSFEKMCIDAKKNGYIIKAESTYRDYDYQQKIYNNYVKKHGQTLADTFSARPGHSEHQTGLAIDLQGSNGDYNLFGDSLEFNWVKSHAHHYGFILRYPENKENITGFKYEPWHIRYVGKIAKNIYENNLTLEEYIEKTM